MYFPLFPNFVTPKKPKQKRDIRTAETNKTLHGVREPIMLLV